MANTEAMENCILVIFGASGDLTQRKLIPALYALYKQGRLPDHFAVLGTSRTEFSDQEFQQKVSENLEDPPEDFVSRLHYQALPDSYDGSYNTLTERLEALNTEHDTSHNYLFYLSLPPGLYTTVARGLKDQKLHHHDSGYRRLIVEKPFGTDLASAKQLNEDLRAIFREHQIYRIDHYLGKETVQNMLVFRFGNGMFEPIWNHQYISHVEITAAESVGVEKRGGYYDDSGALRDMVQNHLMQVLGMIAMEPPASLEANAIRNESLKVFQSLRPLPEGEALEKVLVRAQYTTHKDQGAYVDEEGVKDDSRTETYVALKAQIDNWRWAGTPFFIRTGKQMPTRVTEVTVHFKPTPHRLFKQECSPFESNSLVLRIQPDEGILLNFGMKIPGAGFDVQPVGMDFHYEDLCNTRDLPEAYERLLLDAMLGDSTLYIRGDASEACWEYLAPVLEALEKDALPLHTYPVGSWGPEAADELIAEHGQWRKPEAELHPIERDC